MDKSVIAFHSFCGEAADHEAGKAMNILDLPTRLHDGIAHYLPTSDLKSLAAAAKVFSNLAQERLCRHIHIEVTDTRYDNCLRKVLIVLLARNDYGTSVRTITIVQSLGGRYCGKKMFRSI